MHDQERMSRKLWHYTMDKDNTGLIDFNEFSLYVKFSLHNADHEFCNRLDERVHDGLDERAARSGLAAERARVRRADRAEQGGDQGFPWRRALRPSE